MLESAESEQASTSTTRTKGIQSDTRKTTSDSSLSETKLHSSPPIPKRSYLGLFYDYHRKRKNFTTGEKIQTNESSHAMTLIQKQPMVAEDKESRQKYRIIWWGKQVEYQEDAIIETIAREFRRLINPAHPKTRWVLGEDENEVFVISKSVQAAQTLEKLEQDEPGEFKKRVVSGKYRGLGELTVFTLFLQELDLKPANIVVDEDGNILTIDGDQSLGSLQDDYAEINYTADDLNALPFIVHTTLYNYFDIRNWGKSSENPFSSAFFDPELSQDANFLHEKHRTILKLLLLSPALLDVFVDCYFPENADGLPSLLREKIKAIFTAAPGILETRIEDDPAFQEYLYSSQAKKDIADFKNTLTQFVITAKKSLCTLYPNAINEIDNTFQNLLGNTSEEDGNEILELLENDKETSSSDDDKQGPKKKSLASSTLVGQKRGQLNQATTLLIQS